MNNRSINKKERTISNAKAVQPMFRTNGPERLDKRQMLRKLRFLKGGITFSPIMLRQSDGTLARHRSAQEC